MKGKMNSDIKVEGSEKMKKVREEERLKKGYMFFLKKVNVKKIYRKIGNKKEIYIYIYIYVKIDKDEYVKLIIYLYIFFKKNKRNNNYVANDVAIRWRNRSLTAINVTLQLLVIYRYR